MNPKKTKPWGTGVSRRNTAFYGVITASLLVGLVGFNVGTRVEGALMRVVVTLLACTAVGYLINIVLFLAGSAPSSAAGDATATQARTSGREALNSTARGGQE